ncbi:hypothetical protein CHS0354_022779 [Potamilus streckersoni]|uniref:C-type lectin domain-containing protein n=1 Tax=Potamilus streckersoni TaxID=2493646 RepID=A0AAE0S1P1_9BIVA|nr:hypothetical protein CHS0354_022779 [Potamilus streckersoni]
MKPLSLFCLLILICLDFLLGLCTCLLESVGDADLEAVRYRLQDEKEKRLLLENDVEIMMIKFAELERRCKKDISQTVTDSASSSQCPYAFVPRANCCYLYVPVQATWIEAQMYCRLFGGSLVSIETPEELTEIRYYLQSSKAPHMVWIDGTDMLNEGVWHWTTNSGSQKMIGNPRVGLWAADMPDNGGQNEHCATLWKRSGPYEGNDQNCSSKLHFICKAQQMKIFARV